MKYYLYEEKDGEYKEVDKARLKSALEEVYEKVGTKHGELSSTM